jgi:CRISPR/Cas system-associated exonuclease Cas4 (RecB family)
MSLLPVQFQFSQRNLQDYVDCRRRFQLRYLQHLAWPAVEAEPMLDHEHRMQVGADFHRLVHRHLLGVPAERLSAMLESDISANGDLQRWWQNYLQYAGDLTGFSEPIAPEKIILVEATLSAPLGAFRLLAKYDLIRWFDSEAGTKVLIVDWKTSQKVPPREWLADRLQTRVYPYLLTQAGVPGEELSPDQIEMVYWFTEHPREPQRFPYSSQQYQSDRDYLSRLVNEIENLDEGDYYLTPDESRCKYCTYRSLCDRGIGAGSLDQDDLYQESDGVDEFELDFDQIAEIEF